MTTRRALLEILADGHFHSGEALGAEIGITRAAIWKQLRALEGLGLTVYAVRGRGYRLDQPIEFLQAEVIQENLPPAARNKLHQLIVLHEIDSTNSYLKSMALQGAASGTACLAEWQRQGRGRRGRNWVSPFGSSLYLSMLWRFPTGPAALAGLSLAVGVALARAMPGSVGPGLGLKWPNDLHWNGQKLGGILVEIAGESSGPSYAVIGVGVNLRMPACAGGTIDQPWTDLSRICTEIPSRNALAAAVLTQLIIALQTFELDGLSSFMNDWRDWDVTAGRAVQLDLPSGVIKGHAQGIADDGAILIQVGDELRRYASGEISLRMIT